MAAAGAGVGARNWINADTAARLSGTSLNVVVDALTVRASNTARIEAVAGAIAFTVSGEPFAMREGESIHTENSHKFTKRSSQLLLAAGGWEPRARWTDEARRFSLVLAEAARPRSAP